MYRVYLVDDEPLALSHLVNTFPWQEHAFEVIGKETDAQIAMREILSLVPDVVFTDIHMGKMSGLKLVETLKERGCQALFVIVSAYDRFEYVRQFMLLEGFDYLIKPVEATQCEELLGRLRNKLETSSGKPKKPPTTSPELNLILAYLQQNYKQKQSLAEISQLFTVSPNYVCRLFSKHLGTTFSKYLTKIRMENATKLLHESTKSVVEIADLCGYEDYFYFCRVFKAEFNCTPTQYRLSGEQHL